MNYRDVVQIEVKGQVVNALVARSVQIAPFSQSNKKTLLDGGGKPLPAEEYLDLIYLDPEAETRKGGPMMKVREMRYVKPSELLKAGNGSCGVEVSAEPLEPAGAVSEPLEPAGDDGSGALKGLAGAAITAMLMVLAVLFNCVPAMAQAPNTTPRWYWATDYNTPPVLGQNPNTYTWNLGQAPNPGSCTGTPGNGAPQFFIFGPTATPYPQYIRDATPSLSEVFTPSSTSLTGSTCGFAGSPVNSHTTFWVSSGTAGLYEAVGTNSGQSYATTVLVDKWWYGAMAALPGPQNPVTVIKAAAGSAHVTIMDTTTSPWTVYQWNGSSYAASLSPSAFPNLDVSSYTGVSAPTALSTAAATNGLIATATTGGTIPASSTYRLAATYVDAAGGETLISTDSASTSTIATGATATNILTVTSPAAATGAVGWRLYVSAASGAAGSEILYTPTCSSGTLAQPYLQPVLAPTTVCPIGANATVTAIVTGTATVPAIANAFPRAAGTSLSFPPFTAAGAVAAAATQTLGVVNFPAGFLNTLGRSLEVCGNGSATTNTAAGTLTLATTLASVPGVTSITPFTAVSGATAASAQADPFNFCITYTTASTGTSGTLEVHGWVLYSLSGTAVLTPAGDIITAVSSAIDLTKQDQLAITIKPTTTALTAAQLRQLVVTPQN